MIVESAGFIDNVIYMKKITEKSGKSDTYSIKLKMVSEKKKGTNISPGKEEVYELEKMLKELTLKQDELMKTKEKLAKMEQEGEVDQKKIDQKKIQIKKEYTATSEKVAKVKAKLKTLQK